MNIFGGTKYQYAEEDRLTNAFLSVLEKSESDLIYSFLQFININAEYSESIDFSSQISYASANSRPDGRIKVNNLIIIIENKRFENLDKNQISRHISGIKQYEDILNNEAYLLLISNANKKPLWVEELNNNLIKIRYTSWSLIYKYFDEYETNDNTTKLLLLLEFTNYLSDLGYSYYKVINMNHTKDIITNYKNIVIEINSIIENFNNLAKQITSHIDHVTGNQQKWEYHIIDPVWLEKHNTIFQFQILYKEKQLRINYEIYADFTGWFGLSEWGKNNRDELLKKFKKVKCKNNWHTSKDYFIYSRDFTTDEINNIFKGDYINNNEFIKDTEYVFRISQMLL